MRPASVVKRGKCLARTAGSAIEALESTDLAAFIDDVLACAGAHVDMWLFCPYHPEGVVTEFARSSHDRKPGPGMAFAAAQALDLDLTESSLRNWVERARADRTHGRTGLTTAEREELARLRKENRILQEEREILKKAAAFFAKERR